jgi:hypothetical protein
VLSRWCCRCDSSPFNCSAIAIFCANNVCNGAVDAGMEGCVVSGLWRIARWRSGVSNTWWRSTVLSQFSNRHSVFQRDVRLVFQNIWQPTIVGGLDR